MNQTFNQPMVRNFTDDELIHFSDYSECLPEIAKRFESLTHLINEEPNYDDGYEKGVKEESNRITKELSGLNLEDFTTDELLTWLEL